MIISPMCFHLCECVSWWVANGWFSRLGRKLGLSSSSHWFNESKLGKACNKSSIYCAQFASLTKVSFMARFNINSLMERTKISPVVYLWLSIYHSVKVKAPILCEFVLTWCFLPRGILWETRSKSSLRHGWYPSKSSPRHWCPYHIALPFSHPSSHHLVTAITFLCSFYRISQGSDSKEKRSVPVLTLVAWNGWLGKSGIHRMARGRTGCNSELNWIWHRLFHREMALCFQRLKFSFSIFYFRQIDRIFRLTPAWIRPIQISKKISLCGYKC